MPDLVLGFLALQFLDRLLEQLLRTCRADGSSALLATEQVAGANLEVQRRDAESAAEVTELADCRQPFLATADSASPGSSGMRMPGDRIGRHVRS